MCTSGSYHSEGRKFLWCYIESMDACSDSVLGNDGPWSKQACKVLKSKTTRTSTATATATATATVTTTITGQVTTTQQTPTVLVKDNCRCRMDSACTLGSYNSEGRKFLWCYIESMDACSDGLQGYGGQPWSVQACEIGTPTSTATVTAFKSTQNALLEFPSLEMNTADLGVLESSLRSALSGVLGASAAATIPIAFEAGSIVAIPEPENMGDYESISENSDSIVAITLEAYLAELTVDTGLATTTHQTPDGSGSRAVGLSAQQSSMGTHLAVKSFDFGSGSGSGSGPDYEGDVDNEYGSEGNGTFVSQTVDHTAAQTPEDGAASTNLQREATDSRIGIWMPMAVCVIVAVLGLAYLCIVYVVPSKYKTTKKNKIVPWQDPETLQVTNDLSTPLPEISKGIAIASDLKDLEYKIKQQYLDALNAKSAGEVAALIADYDGDQAGTAAMIAAEGDLNEAAATLFAAKLFEDVGDFKASVRGEADDLNSKFMRRLYDLGGDALVDGLQKKVNGDPGGAEALELATGQTLAQIEREAVKYQLALGREKHGKAAQTKANLQNRLARRMKAVKSQYVRVLAETAIIAKKEEERQVNAAAQEDKALAPRVRSAVAGRLMKTVRHYDQYPSDNDQAIFQSREKGQRGENPSMIQKQKERAQGRNSLLAPGYTQPGDSIRRPGTSPDPFARSQRVIRPQSTSGKSSKMVNKKAALAQRQHGPQFLLGVSARGPTGRPMGMPPRGAGGSGRPPMRRKSPTQGGATGALHDPFARVLPPNGFTKTRAPRVQGNQQRRVLRPISSLLKKSIKNSATDAAAAQKSSRLSGKAATKRTPLLIGAYTNKSGQLAKPKLGAVGGIPTERMSSSGLAKLISSPFGTAPGVNKF